MTTFAMPGLKLYDALANVLPHASDDGTLPAINAVSVDVGDDGLVTFVATDRYTIGVVEAVSHPNRELEPGTFLIPAGVARDIAKLAKTARIGCATVTHSERGVITTTLDTGESTTARDETGQFPKWRSLWPDDSVEPVAVDRIGLGSAHLAKFAKLYCDGRAIKLPTLACTFRGATKPVVITVDLGYAGHDLRALIMPIRLEAAAK